MDKIREWTDAVILQMGKNESLRILGQIANQCADHVASEDGNTERLKGVHEALERLEVLFGLSPELLVIQSMILSKSGRFDEAVQLARSAFRESATWHHAIAVGNAERRAGKYRLAYDVFMQAAEIAPDDVTALLEAGDIGLECGQWSAAIGAYELALKRQEDQHWAKPSICFCSYQLTRDSVHLDDLKEMANSPQDECGLENTLTKIFGGYPHSQQIQRAQRLLARIISD